MRPIRPKIYTYNDVISDDDPTRLVHATDALSDDVFQKLACEGDSCVCQGSRWSANILAEIWGETSQHCRPAVGPRIGVQDPTEPGFENSTEHRVQADAASAGASPSPLDADLRGKS